MSALIWNMRGFGNPAALTYLKNLISIHKPIILGILEPKQPASKIAEYAHKLGIRTICMEPHLILMFGFSGHEI